LGLSRKRRVPFDFLDVGVAERSVLQVVAEDETIRTRFADGALQPPPVVGLYGHSALFVHAGLNFFLDGFDVLLIGPFLLRRNLWTCERKNKQEDQELSHGRFSRLENVSRTN